MHKYLPTAPLRPYVRYIAIAENDTATTYRVLPGTGLVMGLQYSGRLATIKNDVPTPMTTAGVTGLTNTYQIFGSSAATGSVLVYFTETGFAHFCQHPVHELFGLSVGLDELFGKQQVRDTEEKLGMATTAAQRVQIVERLLLWQLKDITADKLVVAAVRLIHESKGTIRIKELATLLHTSLSPLEKRFRKVVGATPRKFASVVRFNAVLDNLDTSKSLTDICYEHNFFDQAHFIKDFKQHTGDSPETFRRQL